MFRDILAVGIWPSKGVLEVRVGLWRAAGSWVRAELVFLICTDEHFQIGVYEWDSVLCFDIFLPFRSWIRIIMK